MADRRDIPAPTAWTGLVFFAGVMLLVIGALNAMYGLVAIFNKTYVVFTSAGLLTFNLTGWGWITLIIGVLEAIVGVAILAGQAWARVIGIAIAGLNIIQQFAQMSLYPIWSILIVALDVFVIYALAAHGREMQY